MTEIPNKSTSTRHTQRILLFLVFILSQQALELFSEKTEDICQDRDHVSLTIPENNTRENELHKKNIFSDPSEK